MVRRFVATLLLVAVPALAAFADDDEGEGHGNWHEGRSRHHGHESRHEEHEEDEEHDGHYDYDRAPRFSNDERDHWRDYWRDQYVHGHCPPGLVRRHDGCIPPGLARRAYRVGYPLPPGVVVVPVPALLLPRLAPCPPGYRYGMIGGDLVQFAIGTSLVVDAIEGLTR